MKKQPTIQKPKAILYLNTSGPNTDKLMNHIAQHVDILNRYMIIEFVYITSENTSTIRRRGITSSPSMIFAGKKYQGVIDIIKILSPKPREQPAIDDLNPEEVFLYWQQKHMKPGDDSGDDSEDETDPACRTRELQEKMAAVQKRRPVMAGVDDNYKLAGGRPISKHSSSKIYGGYGDQNGDSIFLQDSGRSETSAEIIPDDQSNGELLLEDYYLDEAFQFGKKNPQPKRRNR